MNAYVCACGRALIVHVKPCFPPIETFRTPSGHSLSGRKINLAPNAQGRKIKTQANRTNDMDDGIRFFGRLGPNVDVPGGSVVSCVTNEVGVASWTPAMAFLLQDWQVEKSASWTHSMQIYQQREGRTICAINMKAYTGGGRRGYTCDHGLFRRSSRAS